MIGVISRGEQCEWVVKHYNGEKIYLDGVIGLSHDTLDARSDDVS